MDHLLSATTYLSKHGSKIRANVFQSLQEHRHIINEKINDIILNNGVTPNLNNVAVIPINQQSSLPSVITDSNSNNVASSPLSSSSSFLFITKPDPKYFDYEYFNMHMNVLNQMTVPAGSKPSLFDIVKVYLLSMKYQLWIKTLFQTLTIISFGALIAIYSLKIVLPMILSSQNQLKFSYLLSSSSSSSSPLGGSNNKSNNIVDSIMFKLFILSVLISTFLSKLSN
jgi:hypothetical protein